LTERILPSIAGMAGKRFRSCCRIERMDGQHLAVLSRILLQLEAEERAEHRYA
jgi:hypothetical protein